MGYGLILAAMVELRPALPIDETRYLDVAWEMHLSGDWLHLTRNFELYTHKPPLLFWLINLVWAVTGVSDFAARLVGPAFAAGSVWAVARLATRLWPEQADCAARAAMALAAFTAFSLYGGATMFDTMLTLAVVLGAGLLWSIGQGEGTARSWIGFGAALALGTYAKGPVILVHLLPILATIRYWAPAPPRWAALVNGLMLALVSALVLVALWLVPALLSGTAAYRHELLWTQSAARVAGGMAHDRPWWFLIALLPAILFPWGWSPRFWGRARELVRADHASRMLAIWAVSALALFSFIASKQAHYLLPELPAMALLIARAASPGTGQSEAPGWTPGGMSMALPLAAIAGFAVLAAAGYLPLRLDLPKGVGAPDIRADLIVFGATCLALAALAGVWRRFWSVALAGIGLAVAGLVLLARIGLMQGYDQVAIAARLHDAAPKGIAIYAMTYNAEFNFAARSSEPVATPHNAADLSAWARVHPAGVIVAPVAYADFSVGPDTVFHFNQTELGMWNLSSGQLRLPE